MAFAIVVVIAVAGYSSIELSKTTSASTSILSGSSSPQTGGTSVLTGSGAVSNSAENVNGNQTTSLVTSTSTETSGPTIIGVNRTLSKITTSTSTLAVTNSSETVPAGCTVVVSASAVYEAYESNMTAATSQYGGRSMCLSGEIYSVSKFENGSYESCTAQEPEVVYLYGNDCVTESGIPPNDLASYIVWFWAGSAAYEGLGEPASMVANCTVDGLDDGNLFLTGCALVQVISRGSPSTCSGCSPFPGGVQISNVTFYVSRQDTLGVVNMTMDVDNPTDETFSFWQVNIPGYLNMSELEGQSEPIGIMHFAPPDSALQLNATIPRNFFGATLPSQGQAINATVFYGEGIGSGEFGDTDPLGTMTVPASVVWYTTPPFGPQELGVESGQLAARSFGTSGAIPTFTCSQPLTPLTIPSSASELVITNNGLSSASVVDIQISSGSQTFRFTPASSCFIDKIGTSAATIDLGFSSSAYFPQNAISGQDYTMTIVLATGEMVVFSSAFR